MQWFEKCKCGKFMNTADHDCIYTNKDRMIKYLQSYVDESTRLLCNILMEYCGISGSKRDGYETERNSEAEAVMFLENIGKVNIVKGSWPASRNIRFEFKEQDKLKEDS